MFKGLNNLGQKLSKITKIVSDVNAIEQLTKGNTKPAKRKLGNKIKNKGWRILK